MNHCVPDFEVDEDYLLPASSSLKRHKKSAMGDEDIMELLWQNGQVVMQSQNQRSVVGNKKSETMPSAATREIRSGVIEEEPTPCNLFMQEDEMVSWLHYPNDDNSLDLYLHNNEIMYPVLPSSAPVTTASTSLPPPPPVVTIPSSRPPIPPLKRVEEEPSQPKFANFLHFSRPSKGNLTGSAPSSSNKISQATVVESNNRSAAEALQSRASHVTESAAFVSGANVECRSFGGAVGTSIAGQEPETCDLSESSSPVTGGSGASASVEPSSRKLPPASDNRKRKGRDTDDTECYSEDAEFEYHDTKKQSRGSNMSTKRSRAAEVHNLSERRRRDRINEKMKALQELIPRCNKSDKASMLDEAIEYLKSLQMQVQMMSMGYNMVPMMFPGVQRYMPTMAPMGMGMGMGMGIGMGMDQAQVGMNRPMIPCPTMQPNHQGAAAAAAGVHVGGPRFPVPPRGFQMPQQVPVPVMGPAAARSSQMANVNPIMNSFPPNQPRFPFPVDPYQQYIGLPQTQLPQPPQNLTCTPNSNKDVREPSRQ